MNCPHCQNDRTYRNGYNNLKSGRAPKRYCPLCKRTFQEKQQGKDDQIAPLQTEDVAVLSKINLQ